jgi:hypothetical protein
MRVSFSGGMERVSEQLIRRYKEDGLAGLRPLASGVHVSCRRAGAVGLTPDYRQVRDRGAETPGRMTRTTGGSDGRTA